MIHPIESPLVSIACVTFNHEQFIGRAIEGFLAQKTSFPVEILIYDDASTDRTAKIVADYHKRHPDAIVPMLQKENVYSKGGHPLMEGVLPKCRGTYIAICEGDDYWTDPFKLQKQVDFLEAHPDHVLVHTDFVNYEQETGRFYSTGSARKPSGEVFEALLKGNFIATLTVLFRRDVFRTIDMRGGFEQSFLQGDYPLWLEFSQKGKIGYINEVTAVYRHLAESASHTRDFAKKEAFYKSTIRIVKYFADKYGSTTFDEKAYTHEIRYHLLVCAIVEGNFEGARRYARLLEPDSLKMKILITGCLRRWTFCLISLGAYARERVIVRRDRVHPQPLMRPDDVSAGKNGSVQHESALVGSESAISID